MGHVITGCEGSVITFWDLNTGRQAQHITEAHGVEEISCMTMDPSGRRLMTGDRTGNIHVSHSRGIQRQVDGYVYSPRID